MKFLNSLSIATKLYILAVFCISILLVHAFMGLQSIERISKGSESMYKDRIIPLQQLRVMARLYALEFPKVLDLRTHKALSIPDTKKELNRLQDSARNTWLAYLTSYLTPKEKKLADSTEKELEKSYQTLSVLASIVEGSDLDTMGIHDFIERQPFEKLSSLLYVLSELQLHVADEIYKENKRQEEEYRVHTIELMVIFLVTLSIGLLAILRNIIPPIHRLHQLSKTVASGDTTIRIVPDKRGDELGDLFRCFGVMVQNIDDNKKELEYQNAILEDQAVEIELMNTSLNENNLQLQQMNSHLMELIQHKNTFLRIATHDLKNPLQSIIMSISLLRMYPEKLNREQFTQKINSVEETVKRMSGIISSFLESSALEDGLLHLTLDNIRLDDVIYNVTDEYKVIAAKKNIALVLQDLPQITVVANCDTTQQCIENILSNAIKFSQPATTITIAITEDKERKTTALCIQDQGPGLTDEDKEKMFIAFAKRSAKPTGGETSTGLGLSIVKMLMEGMGGSIHCESELGKGSTFILTFRNSTQSNK